MSKRIDNEIEKLKSQIKQTGSKINNIGFSNYNLKNKQRPIYNINIFAKPIPNVGEKRISQSKSTYLDNSNVDVVSQIDSLIPTNQTENSVGYVYKGKYYNQTKDKYFGKINEYYNDPKHRHKINNNDYLSKRSKSYGNLMRQSENYDEPTRVDFKKLGIYNLSSNLLGLDKLKIMEQSRINIPAQKSDHEIINRGKIEYERQLKERKMKKDLILMDDNEFLQNIKDNSRTTKSNVIMDQFREPITKREEEVNDFMNDEILDTVVENQLNKKLEELKNRKSLIDQIMDEDVQKWQDNKQQSMDNYKLVHGTDRLEEDVMFEMEREARKHKIIGKNTNNSAKRKKSKEAGGWNVETDFQEHFNWNFRESKF